ncbi:hypothetical protein TRIUR3_09326 [Triticum urartu]|uniref:Uncharacterized protein n=1 Tax=Triticum urartu TaxID=4572 RepID=M7Z9P5_TRIUA|nr:hypothetical protein TRIUR3_09326 [Triticum urartu]
MAAVEEPEAAAVVELQREAPDGKTVGGLQSWHEGDPTGRRHFLKEEAKEGREDQALSLEINSAISRRLVAEGSLLFDVATAEARAHVPRFNTCRASAASKIVMVESDHMEALKVMHQEAILPDMSATTVYEECSFRCLNFVQLILVLILRILIWQRVS